MTPVLVVVIATSGRRGTLARTLRSLAEGPWPEACREVVVVENGPKSGAEEVVRNAAMPLAVRYVYRNEGNKSKALNAVLEGLDDCLACFFDDDVRVAPGTLCAYAEAVGAVSSGRMYGGPLGVDYEIPPPDWLVPYLPNSAKGWSLDASPASEEMPFFLGANWAAFACDVRRIGGFHVHRGPSPTDWTIGEETDLQRRLRCAGVEPVYVPEAMVWHWVPADRCSPGWALRRAYQVGMASTLHEIDRSPACFGYPRWMIPALAARLGHWVLTRLSRDEKTRFVAAREYRHWLGMMQGYRLGRRRRIAGGE